MESERFHSVFSKHFGFQATPEQALLTQKLGVFNRQIRPFPVFVLRGYAGTGKTAVLGAFVKTREEFRMPTVLLAPTGRAAKVFSKSGGKKAYTIHKYIYRYRSKIQPGEGFEVAPNLHKNTCFIVDEASMLGDGDVAAGVGRDLLGDLFNYVFSGKSCCLILVGDAGQLPPVGSDRSPALDVSILRTRFPSCQIESYELTDVLRQAKHSDLLRNASKLRLPDLNGYPKFELSDNADLIFLEGSDLQDVLESAYERYGLDETIVITRSNKRANLYNQQIRNRILWFEDDLCGGELLMIVRNNYYWVPEQSSMGFIANGELLRVIRIHKSEELYGLHFVRVTASFPDYPEMGECELLLIKDVLALDGPAMSRDQYKELFFAIEKDYLHVKLKKERYEAILKDPYFNALQVKYAYAVTCHKAQGGQWNQVFIDQGLLTDEQLNSDYYRWLYTALTRASEKAYLINFGPEYRSETNS